MNKPWGLSTSSLSNLASLYQAQGKYEQAEPLYQRVLAIFEMQLGPEHPYTGTCLNNLAGLYQAQGKYEQAEPLYQRALPILGKIVGPQHPITIDVKQNLASLHQKDNQINEETEHQTTVRHQKDGSNQII